jgi:hypothetical protein
MKKEYSKTPTVPHQWITKGWVPGIWCALFDPCNASCFPNAQNVIQFKFKAEFQVYDPNRPEHQKLWQVWSSNSKNLAKPNSWDIDKNDKGQSMKERMAGCHAIFFSKYKLTTPDHFEFYKEYRFGAMIGYHDYAALVILDEAAVDKVTFLDSQNPQTLVKA